MSQQQEVLDALVNLQKEIRAHHKMDVKKDYSLMVADAQASKVIASATQGALDTTAPQVKEAVVLLRQVERWMSGYGTTTQPEMRERIRAFLASNNLQDFEG